MFTQKLKGNFVKYIKNLNLEIGQVIMGNRNLTRGIGFVCRYGCGAKKTVTLEVGDRKS